jgi:hypothetical protein
VVKSVDTERLIQSLARGVEPVRPLRRPAVRVAAWVAGAAVYLGALIVVMSPRDDLGTSVQDTQFLMQQGAALMMGLTAAAAALASVVPGKRLRLLLLLPVASLAVWLGLIGARALQDAQTLGLAGALLQVNWRCVTAILVGAAVPAVAMAHMLRRGAPLTPRLTAGLGGLAAAGLGNVAVCLSHPHGFDLIWHAGTVLLLAVLAAWVGARILRWPQSPSTVRSA